MVAAAAIGGAVIGGIATTSAAKKSAGATDKASSRASQDALRTAQQSEAFNRERFEQAERYLNPYLERELQASNQLLFELGLTPYQGTPGQLQQRPELSQDEINQRAEAVARGGGFVGGPPRADSLARYTDQPEYTPVRNIQPNRTGGYRQAPGYAASLDALDRLEEEGYEAVNQGAAGSGTLYSGRRGEQLREVGAGTQLARARTENQFYNNYINTLQNLANPTSTTNLSAAGLDQGATIGQQNIAAQNQATGYQLQGVAAQNAIRADQAGALANIGSSLIQNYPTSSGGGGVPINQAQANATGTITPNYAYL